jgi:cell division protease FtsH
LERNRPQVLALAHALETHKTITGEDVAAVVEGTVGPTVDGRSYHVLGFGQMLENYHAAVVRAHKEHGGVATPIPVPVPSSPIALVGAAEPEVGDPGSAGEGPAMRPSTQSIGGPPPRPDS